MLFILSGCGAGKLGSIIWAGQGFRTLARAFFLFTWPETGSAIALSLVALITTLPLILVPSFSEAQALFDRFNHCLRKLSGLNLFTVLRHERHSGGVAQPERPTSYFFSMGGHFGVDWDVAASNRNDTELYLQVRP